MEEIIVTKKGITPKIYYTHTCNQCEAQLDILSTVTRFNCPECENPEICIQDPRTIKKVYIKNDGITRTESKKAKHKK